MHLFSSRVLLLITFCVTSHAQVQIFNWTTAATNFTDTCVTVLNSVVTCNSSLQWAGNGRFEDATTLNGLCTATCATSLSTWLRRVSGACTTRYNDGAGNLILPAYYVEDIVENYNLLCLKRSSSFCNLVVGSKVGINPADQSQTATPAPTVTCDDCFLMSLSTQIQMPLRSRSEYVATLKSLTSACHKTGFSTTPVSTQTSYIISASTSVSGSGCAGSTYTIKSGDTCSSVSNSQGISTLGLLTANSNLICNKFPTSGSLCIPSGAKCKIYTLKAGDDCAKVADANHLTWTQVVTWNPSLARDCSNVAANIGNQICVSNPGGSWQNPSPAAASTTSSFTIPAFVGTAVSLLPTPTYPGSVNGSGTWSYTYASGTRLDCATYANGSTFGNHSDCSTVAKNFGVSVTDLQFWNPSLTSDCSLDPSYSYCVQRIQINSTNLTPTCVLFDTPVNGEDCSTFRAAWGLPLEVFTAWNPAVGSQCEKWQYGLQYCVMVQHFRQPGIVSSCNKYTMANNSDWRDDPCGKIETKFGLSHGRFVAWNPAVQDNCYGLQQDYDYCVSIPGYKPTYTTQSSQLPTSTKKPATTTSAH